MRNHKLTDIPLKGGREVDQLRSFRCHRQIGNRNVAVPLNQSWDQLVTLGWNDEDGRIVFLVPALHALGVELVRPQDPHGDPARDRALELLPATHAAAEIVHERAQRVAH